MTQSNNAPTHPDALSCGMQQKLTARQHLERVQRAIRLGLNATDKPLIKKLEECGVKGMNGEYRCKTSLCYRCRCTNQRKQERESINLLGHFQNKDLVFVTVVLGATSNIGGLSPLIAKSRQDTRNCFVAARRRDPRWDGTYFKAWHEIDAVGTEHMPILPPDRLSLIPQLAPMAAQTLSPTWLPTFHGMMFTNGLSMDEIKFQFRRQWKLDHQVEIEAFHDWKPVTTNIANIASYANKFHTTVSLDGGVRELWPASWAATFFGWSNSAHRNAFEGLRMTINQHDRKQELEVCRAIETLSPMPFIHAFTSDSIHKTTGAWA